MAKATSKEKGFTARPRPAQAASRAGTIPVREPEQDLATDEETSLAGGSAASDAAPDDQFDESAEEGAADDLDGAPSRSVARTPARTAAVPAPLMANSLTRFLVESAQELRKVVRPTPEEAWNMTLIVIAMSAIVAVILAGADFGLTRALTWLVSVGSQAR